MSWHRLFFADSGALRAPWRVFVFCVASAVGMIAAQTIAGPLITRLLGLAGVRGVISEAWVEVLGLLAGTAVALRWVDRRQWRDVWLDRDAARPLLLGFGFLIGAVAIGLPVLLLIGARWLREAPSTAGSWWAAAFRVSAFLLPAALLEELMTRGYILSVLRDWLGWKWAIVVTSVGFGLLHLENPGANVESVLLVTTAGFFLAAVLYATRSLYAAWMAHFAWNWAMAVVFHTAVSGIPLESPRYRYVEAGPDWATGGVWGPEGGVPAGLCMVGGMAYLFARRPRRARDRET